MATNTQRQKPRLRPDVIDDDTLREWARQIAAYLVEAVEDLSGSPERRKGGALLITELLNVAWDVRGPGLPCVAGGAVTTTEEQLKNAGIEQPSQELVEAFDTKCDALSSDIVEAWDGEIKLDPRPRVAQLAQLVRLHWEALPRNPQARKDSTRHQIIEDIENSLNRYLRTFGSKPLRFGATRHDEAGEKKSSGGQRKAVDAMVTQQLMDCLTSHGISEPTARRAVAKFLDTTEKAVYQRVKRAQATPMARGPRAPLPNRSSSTDPTLPPQAEADETERRPRHPAQRGT